MKREIARITAAEAVRSFREYVALKVPVIIEDLYRGEQLLEINTPEKMSATLGETEINVGANYYDKFLLDEKLRPNIKDYTIKISEYIKLAAQFPSMELMCREQPMNANLEKLFAPSSLTNIFDNPDPKLMFYVAKDQTVAPLHFDGDLREVLFTQIVGSKIIHLIEPSYGIAMRPVRNFSGIAVHRLETEQKEDFFNLTNAYWCRLEPGDTIYMPKLWWHTLANEGITMAASVRFATSAHKNILKKLPLNFLFQNIAHELLEPLSGLVKDFGVLEELEHVNSASYVSDSLRTESLIAKMESIYTALLIPNPSSAVSNY